MITLLPTQNLPDVLPVRPETSQQTTSNGFTQFVTKANELLAKADATAAGYAQGKIGLTDAVLASERADTTFQVLMAVRNRALAAYQEIMNLQV